jgi:hypothetical protein
MSHPIRTIKTFKKRKADVQDYDVDFTPYLTDISDTAVTHEVTSVDGLPVLSSTMTAGVVKVWIDDGGDADTFYIVLVKITTGGGREREVGIGFWVLP